MRAKVIARFCAIDELLRQQTACQGKAFCWASPDSGLDWKLLIHSTHVAPHTDWLRRCVRRASSIPQTCGYVRASVLDSALGRVRQPERIHHRDAGDRYQ